MTITLYSSSLRRATSGHTQADRICTRRPTPPPPPRTDAIRLSRRPNAHPARPALSGGRPRQAAFRSPGVRLLPADNTTRIHTHSYSCTPPIASLVVAERVASVAGLPRIHRHTDVSPVRVSRSRCTLQTSYYCLFGLVNRVAPAQSLPLDRRNNMCRMSHMCVCVLRVRCCRHRHCPNIAATVADIMTIQHNVPRCMQYIGISSTAQCHYRVLCLSLLLRFYVF